MEKKHIVIIGKYQTTAENAIREALEEQAQHLKADTKLIIVEDAITALTGNLFHPNCLWVEAQPTDNLNFAKGLDVVIFPSSEQSAELWKQTGIGQVLSILHNPNELIPGQ